MGSVNFLHNEEHASLYSSLRVNTWVLLLHRAGGNLMNSNGRLRIFLHGDLGQLGLRSLGNLAHRICIMVNS